MPSELFARGASDVLYVVDLSGYVLRAYHAISPLTSPTGEPTHAVFGTVSMLERLVREREPSLLVVAMDSGRKTFRTEIYPEYKANRPPSPADLKPQIERCEEVVRAFSIPVLRQGGVEADDLIACAVDRALDQGLRVVIVTADKDLMQLVSERVLMWDTMRDRVVGPEEVQAKFGVRPGQVRDLIALVGDTSDNIPGVPSVGPKTARDLLIRHGTLEDLYGNLEQVERKKLREALATHRDAAFLSQRLATLRRDLQIDFDLSDLSFGGRDLGKLEQLYAELGFTRHLEAVRAQMAAARGPKASPPAAAAAEAGPIAQEVVTDLARLRSLVDKASRADALGVHVEYMAHRPGETSLIGISLFGDNVQGLYLPIAHRNLAAGHQIEGDAVRATLGPLLANPQIRKTVHDSKQARLALSTYGLGLAGVDFDPQLASYLLDPEGHHGLDAIAQRELRLELPVLAELLRRERAKRVDLDELPPDRTATASIPRAHAAWALRPILQDRLADARLMGVLKDIELPLSPMLAEMQARGVLVDTEKLHALGQECERDLKNLEQAAWAIAGRTFNVHSPRQLETLLFDELGLKPLKRTKTARSTDAVTLGALSGQHELPRVVLEIRQLAKLKNTYIDALPALVSAKTGRVHTTWEQAVTATGRLSSTEPNLQNIPIRSPLGRSIRAAFVAPPGHVLVSADYSQVELRVLAHLSQDPVLVDAFRAGQDVHTRTAMELFNVDGNDVTPEMRRRSKAVNFGVIYGQGETGLAKSLGIPRKEAADFIAAYFARYGGVRRFMEETLGRAREGEAVRSLAGRRRLVPHVNSGNRAQRLAAERVAMNMPIQGTAADLLKCAMLAFADPVTPGARLVLSVHDELVFEIPTPEVQEATSKIRDTMQNVWSLDVPLAVDVGHGPDWNAAH